MFMRKRIIAPDEQPKRPELSAEWLDLDRLATVEITSEDAAHPIESALATTTGPGWRAEIPGKQIIRLVFDEPLKIKHVQLVFREEEHARTQEFALSWKADKNESSREILRQQYNFSPPETTLETEDYELELNGVVMLELNIIPDISDGPARASLSKLRLA
jgi:hypothetical protein